jgi:RNA polymerase sigma-70 factor (ECF subfamily)
MSSLPLELFERERPRLLRVAYRMLGSIRDAEDVVQDAWVRWSSIDATEIASPEAFLATMVSRLCFDALRSAHARRVEYVGQWLPEPILGSDFDRVVDDPESRAEVADELSLGFLLLLERLNPVERAVFVLRESLGFGYADIATVVGRSEAHCRQIERRARLRLAEARRARDVEPAERTRLLEGFLGAVRAGDVDGLVRLLTADCTSLADGGGMAGVSRNPIEGAHRVARFFVGLVAKAPPGTRWRIGELNGSPALLTYVDGHLHNAIAIEAEEGAIGRFLVVVNPAKLVRD